MPRRRRRQPKQNRRRRQNLDIVRIPFTAYSTATLAAGATNFGIQPSAFTQTVAVADVYEFFRCTQLSYRLIPSNTITVTQAAVYMPGVVDAATAMSVTAITQSPHHVILGAKQTTPTQWVKVPRVALASFATWYKALAGTPDTDLEVQGTVFLAGTGTELVSYEIRGMMEFKDPINSAATPAMRAEIAQKRERARLLKLLGFENVPLAIPSPALPRYQTPGGM